MTINWLAFQTLMGSTGYLAAEIVYTVDSDALFQTLMGSTGYLAGGAWAFGIGMTVLVSNLLRRKSSI